ncbi:RAMP superfamily CRISPR-associated protein [Thermoanaerobacter sp. CM-CNRG TB177]|uniref:RAMP superfamily CRISPR-associated protein n=1 Tax=Thermoanaerobacter sp. CM-CNRG TB177 TaxID=2800659 RepID=UPI001BDDEF53|nr:RAMP superfamily CRISPR-associated protein [Thermoanaerobacter sp. CM-CNRG TB177]MBT1279458.1 type III-B CRISPR module RAMP protein Cmr4 [Thermoanaerobacter sp. CM-CNRG TB177]
MCENLYEVKTYYAIALDPIHVGAGGARLERVDLPIIREPGTNIPKIPGTSLSGSARAYTAMKTERYRWKDSEGKEYSCAGRGGEGGEKHCGKVNPACPVCVPYGFSRGTGSSMQGLAQFFDAHILFFPVASIVGPVWVTSPLAREGLRLETDFQVQDEGFYPLGQQLQNEQRLNFGWLMLNKGQGRGNIDSLPIPEKIKQRAVLVSDKVFSFIVNSNLEVRTSVSIDPATGTAEEGALFTYEAIPRGTVFRFDVVYNSGKYFNIGGQELKTEGDGDVGIQWVKAQVEKGLKLFETLGIGGMGTRGMGRLKVLNLQKGDC